VRAAAEPAPRVECESRGREGLAAYLTGIDDPERHDEPDADFTESVLACRALKRDRTSVAEGQRFHRTRGAALTGHDLQTWWKSYVQPRRDRQSRSNAVEKLTVLGLGVLREVDQRLTNG